MENPQPNMTAIEKTDEEIWRAIRDLDPHQRRNTSDLACVIAIAVACVVWRSRESVEPASSDTHVI